MEGEYAPERPSLKRQLTDDDSGGKPKPRSRKLKQMEAAGGDKRKRKRKRTDPKEAMQATALAIAIARRMPAITPQLHEEQRFSRVCVQLWFLMDHSASSTKQKRPRSAAYGFRKHCKAVMAQMQKNGARRHGDGIWVVPCIPYVRDHLRIMAKDEEDGSTLSNPIRHLLAGLQSVSSEALSPIQ
jgi:hypothetical protein